MQPICVEIMFVKFSRNVLKACASLERCVEHADCDPVPSMGLLCGVLPVLFS